MTRNARRRVFVSYRRDDTAFVVGHLVDRLEVLLGEHRLFRDLDSIPYGDDYEDAIRRALDECAAALVVIGAEWEGASRDGRRIDDPTDLVRIEVVTMLRRGIPVVPVLVDDITSLDHLQLPDELRGLRTRNAARLRRDPDFDRDCERIAAALGPHLDSEVTEPTAHDEVEELRRRLLTADPIELERLVFEVRSLLARHPDDPEVMQFANTVERARLLSNPPSVAPPPDALLPRALRRSRSPVGWLVVAAVAILLLVGIAIVATILLDDGGSNTPTTQPFTTDAVGDSPCDRLRVSVTGAEIVELLDGSRRARLSLRIDNDGDDVVLPSGTEASFVDSEGVVVSVGLPTSSEGTWFLPIDLAGGRSVETSVETEADWLESGRTLTEVRIPRIREVDEAAAGCTFTGRL